MDIVNVIVYEQVRFVCEFVLQKKTTGCVSGLPKKCEYRVDKP